MNQPDKIERTEEEQARAVVIHDSSREDLLKRQLSNSENYDKAILSLSSAGLALSVTVIKFIVPLDKAENLWTLKISWGMFLITIISSLLAFLISNKAISRQLDIQEDYYINCSRKAQTESNNYSKVNSIINNITGVTFAFAISLVIYFVIVNLHGDRLMTDQKNSKETKKVFVFDSAQVPKMQLTPALESADIPAMQLAPEKVKTVTTPTPASGDSSTTEKSENK